MATNSKLSQAMRGNKNAAGPHDNATWGLAHAGAKVGSKIGGTIESAKMRYEGAKGYAKAGVASSKEYGLSKKSTVQTVAKLAVAGNKAGAQKARESSAGEIAGANKGAKIGANIGAKIDKVGANISKAKSTVAASVGKAKATAVEAKGYYNRNKMEGAMKASSPKPAAETNKLQAGADAANALRKSQQIDTRSTGEKIADKVYSVENKVRSKASDVAKKADSAGFKAVMAFDSGKRKLSARARALKERVSSAYKKHTKS
jgi:hypothetical protein